MAFKMKGAPYLKSAFKDGGHGGEPYHTHETKPVPGAPTAKPSKLNYLSQEVINKMALMNEKAASSSSNSKTKSKKRKGKGGYSGGSPGSKGRKKTGDNVTYKCTSKGCSAMN